MGPDLVGHLLGQLGPAVVHGEHDGGHLEPLIEVRLDQVHVSQKLPEAFQGVVLALDGHEHLVRGSQAVDRDQPQRGRAVDEGEVEVPGHALEGLAQLELPAEGGDQLDLGSGQVDGGGGHEEVLQAGRLDTILQRGVAHDDVVHGQLEGAAVDAETGGGVALRVQIYDQDAKAQLSKAGP